MRACAHPSTRLAPPNASDTPAAPWATGCHGPTESRPPHAPTSTPVASSSPGLYHVLARKECATTRARAAGKPAATRALVAAYQRARTVVRRLLATPLAPAHRHEKPLHSVHMCGRAHARDVVRGFGNSPQSSVRPHEVSRCRDPQTRSKGNPTPSLQLDWKALAAASGPSTITQWQAIGAATFRKRRARAQHLLHRAVDTLHSRGGRARAQGRQHMGSRANTILLDASAASAAARARDRRDFGRRGGARLPSEMGHSIATSATRSACAKRPHEFWSPELGIEEGSARQHEGTVVSEGEVMARARGAATRGIHALSRAPDAPCDAPRPCGERQDGLFRGLPHDQNQSKTSYRCRYCTFCNVAGFLLQ